MGAGSTEKQGIDTDLTKNIEEMNTLLKNINPEKIQSPSKDKTLRHARNAIWTLDDPRNKHQQLTIKQPVTMYPHKAFLDRFKPSKAKRSWNGAMELLRRGIDSPLPVAYFEKAGDGSLKQNYYICEYHKSDFNIAEIFSAFARDETSYKNITPNDIYPQFSRFCNYMHKSGIHFRETNQIIPSIFGRSKNDIIFI